MPGRAVELAFKNPYRGILASAIRVPPFREGLFFTLDWALRKHYRSNRDNRPLKVQDDKSVMASALLHSLNKGLSEGRLSPHVFLKGLHAFSNYYTKRPVKRTRFNEHFGFDPPGFLTLSPNGSCNLSCSGCYANSSDQARNKLDFGTISRVLREQKQFWGSHLTVISGGEPLLWRSDGKSILDLASEHKNTFFLVYTNGTMISHSVAQTLAKLGTVSPAISVEGFEKETDARRGKGVFKRVLQAFRSLRAAGVPFGISVTATRSNAELIMGEDFLDYYLNKEGAFYCWVFQYMPIGKGANLDSVVTPEQRLSMYKKTWMHIREKKMFIADFWNCGTTSNGCISAGLPGGYFYIDWNGNVMPCVFNPFYVDNINEVYARGGTLNDVLFSRFFGGIRDWQHRYAYTEPAQRMGNILAPCPVRDHFQVMQALVSNSGAQTSEEQAGRAMLEDDDFRQGLIAYGTRVAELTNDIWEREYLEPERQRNNHD